MHLLSLFSLNSPLYEHKKLPRWEIIGITHVFSCIDICVVPRNCLNTRPIGRVLTHLLRDPASVNAMKQTCVIVILAYFKYFQIQTHVQTARESPGLNMDFRSFDNELKQLYEYVSMQEKKILICFRLGCYKMRTFILVFLSVCAMIGLSLAMNYKYQYYPVPYLVQPPRAGGFDGSFIGSKIKIIHLQRSTANKTSTTMY